MLRPLVRHVLGLALLIVACTPPAPTGGQQAPPEEKRAASQVLRFAAAAMPTSASPEATSAQNYIFNAQFDTMVDLDGKFQLKPQAATRWEFLPNENAWRFFLRNDLTFSNGDKVTSADVAFTANLIATQLPPLPQKAVLAKLTGAKIVDDYTVDITTSERDASVLYGMPYFHVFPKKYYEEVGRVAFGQKPIGSGPYELVDYKANDSIGYKLRSTPHPFRKPIATEIRWKAVPEASAMINGIRTGELDGAFGGLTVEQAEIAKRDSYYLAAVSPTTLVISLDRPANEKFTPAILDKRVRQALNYAIDRPTIVKTLYKGFADPLNQIAVPGTPASDPSIPPVPFDPALAKRLLAEAGYPNGFKVTNPLDYQATGLYPQVMLAVQDYWKQIGVEVSLNVVDSALWVDKMYSRNNQTRNEMTQSAGQDNNGLLLFYRGFITCNQPANRVIWCVPEFDRNMDAAYAEPDTTKRNELIRAAIKAHTAEWPYIYLVSAPTYVIGGPKVRGMLVEALTFWKSDAAYRID